MFVNVIHSYREVVAICDENLIGQKFEEGKFQLDVKESFYKGEQKTPEETLKIIEAMTLEDATFNIVGEKSIALAIQAGIISEESIKRIKEIPFAMILL